MSYYRIFKIFERREKLFKIHGNKLWKRLIIIFRFFKMPKYRKNKPNKLFSIKKIFKFFI